MVDSAPRAGVDGERLPWLEPYREPEHATAAAKPSPREARPRRRLPDRFFYTVAALGGLVAALGGGYLLGERHVLSPELPKPVPVAEAEAQADKAGQSEPIVVANLQVDEPETDRSSEVEAAPAVATDQSPPRADARPAPPSARPKPSVRPARSRTTNSRKSAAAAQSAYVRRKQQEAARTWPKMPSPGPAGQVIQLGAFSSKGRAEATYRRRATRYPLLATMPKVVVPVITQPEGQVLYVLRLGTVSRDQSQIVCRNLQASGDHCLVIG